MTRSIDELLTNTVACNTREDLERKLKAGRPLRVKLGVDPSSADLHIGHSVVLRHMRRLQDLGHQAVFIIGQATAMVGDPSGKNAMRPQLTREDVAANAQTYFDQARLILDMDAVEVVYNSSWFDEMGFMDAIRLGGLMTVARMMERDTFEKRYKAGEAIGIHEFFYPLMQGRDSVEVKADIELGGTDQTFNLLVGRDLMREAGLEPQVCLTLPLLRGLDGTQKMSKSLGNAIGLTDPPRDMFGKAMSLPDELMEEWYKLVTDVPAADAAAAIAASPRDAKVDLARRIVATYHGDEAGASAVEEFERIFRQKGLPDEIPESELPGDMVDDDGVWIIRVLTHLGMAASASAARRLVKEGGVRVDGERVNDEQARVAPGTESLVQVGKRRFHRVTVPAR